MVLSKEFLPTAPAMRSLPPKPKRSEEPPISILNEIKALPKKPVVDGMDLLHQYDAWESINWESINDELNTPTLDDCLMGITTTVDADLADTPTLDDCLMFPTTVDADLADTQPLEPQSQPQVPNIEETWDLQDCVPPAEAEGRDEVFEIMCPVSVSLEPFMTKDVNDMLDASLKESGIDLSAFMMHLGPSDIPEPIASTPFFIQSKVQEPVAMQVEAIQEPVAMLVEPGSYQLQTIDMGAIEAVSPPILSPTSNLPIVLSSPTAKEDKEDREWFPEDEDEDEDEEDWNQPSTSKASTSKVYARKTNPPMMSSLPSLHGVRKRQMKRKPGRPERQEPFVITEVPSQKMIDSVGIPNSEVVAIKYRRMRDLNNKASQKCRAVRKNKQQEMEMEVEVLTERNNTLKAKLAAMEVEVAYYRRATGNQ